MRRFLLAHITEGNWVRRTLFSQSRGSKRFHEENILVITTPRAPWGLGHLIFFVKPCCDEGHTPNRHLGNIFPKNERPQGTKSLGKGYQENFSLLFCPKYSFLDLRLNYVFGDRKD